MASLLSGCVSVPTGVAVFPSEIYKPPKAWADTIYNITHWSEQPRVGDSGMGAETRSSCGS